MHKLKFSSVCSSAIRLHVLYVCVVALSLFLPLALSLCLAPVPYCFGTFAQSILFFVVHLVYSIDLYDSIFVALNISNNSSFSFFPIFHSYTFTFGLALKLHTQAHTLPKWSSLYYVFGSVIYSIEWRMYVKLFFELSEPS